MSRRYYGYYEYFPPSRPREAKGGIKAQSKRGGFGESWWAKRWIAVLESFNIGARLGRGRSYARSGQVLNINIAQGSISADVQGSRAKPYSVKIKVKALSEKDWKKIAAALAGQAIFAARLLNGEMPNDIEDAFKAAGFSLFPEKLKDLETGCSCPDWSNPCKHIAAVYYLLGEEFDRDPFLIFKLRGMERDAFMSLMCGARAESETCKPRDRKKGKAASVDTTPAQDEPHGDTPEPAASEPLDTNPTAFWKGAGLPADLFGEVSAPAIDASLPKRLGAIPFWRADTRFLDAVEPFYKHASEKGLQIFIGDTGPAAD